MTFNLLKTVDTANILGECVLWNPDTQMIWWVDIESKKLYSYAYSSQALETYNVPERLGSFAMIKGTTSFMAAFETGLAIYDPAAQSVDWLEKIYEKGCGTRLNDGRVDRKGRFWVGGMIEAEKEKIAAAPPSNLFRFTGDKTLTVQAENIQISNSLCWSPDGTVMYFADSPKNTILAYDVAPGTGDITNKRIFALTKPGVHPDGSCVDKDGYVWNAQWGAGQVVRYTPQGKIDAVLDVPSLQPTCVSFGGPEMNHLFVTSARLDMSEKDKAQYPSSGALFIYDTPYTGLEENQYQFAV